MRLSIMLAISLLASPAVARTLRVAIIDTGYQREMLKDPIPLCSKGHADFTTDNNPFLDKHGHGTHVAGTIHKYDRGADVCYVILKYYNPRTSNPLGLLISAFLRAYELKVDVVNYSGGGLDYSVVESAVIHKMLDSGIKIVAAAGNEKSDLRRLAYWPACYDARIHSVTALDPEGHTLPSSNYVDVKNIISNKTKCANLALYSEVGLNAEVVLSDGRIFRMTGTSQAAATHTGKWVYQLSQTQLQGRLVKIKHQTERNKGKNNEQKAK